MCMNFFEGLSNRETVIKQHSQEGDHSAQLECCSWDSRWLDRKLEEF